ncbi:DoxX family protein [Streptomyces sp. NPDC094143]|uniref:DoxX family protein n=1 Tax=Streptomyces sp. NPDC094143 TaxID=3155310 RepID=UPI00331D7BD9
MNAVLITVETLLAAMFLVSGTGHLVGRSLLSTPVGRLGFTPAGRRGVGALEGMAGAALLAGTWLPAPELGVAAAVSLFLLAGGALSYHHWTQDNVLRCMPAATVTVVALVDASVRFLL